MVKFRKGKSLSVRASVTLPFEHRTDAQIICINKSDAVEGKSIAKERVEAH
jgi:hypothetical protein